MTKFEKIKKYNLKKFRGYSKEVQRIISGFIAKLYTGGKITAQKGNGDSTPIRVDALIPESIYLCCRIVYRFLDLGARSFQDKKDFSPFTQDAENDIGLCKGREKLNDQELYSKPRKYNIDVKTHLRYWFAYLTELEECPPETKEKLYDLVVLMPKEEEPDNAKHGAVFMSPYEVRNVLRMIKSIVPKCNLEYYRALCAFRLCAARPGNETYGTYIDDFELDEKETYLNDFVLGENGLLAEYMYGCGRWNLPKETSKQKKSPSHPDYGTPIFPYARILINEHLGSKFMKKYIEKCRKEEKKPLLFPPVANHKKRGGWKSFSDRVYGDRFLIKTKYRDAIAKLLDESHKGMYLTANDFRRTCAHLIENIEFRPIIRELKRMGANVNLKHTLLKIISYMMLRHSFEGMGKSAHWRSYTNKEVGQQAFYYVVSKTFEFLMCDVNTNEKEAEQKFEAWIKTYYWPDDLDEPSQNISNEVSHTATKNNSMQEKLSRFTKEKETLEKELDATIDDGSIEMKVKRIRLSKQIQESAAKIEKLEKEQCNG